MWMFVFLLSRYASFDATPTPALLGSDPILPPPLPCALRDGGDEDSPWSWASTHGVARSLEGVAHCCHLRLWNCGACKRNSAAMALSVYHSTRATLGTWHS